MKMKRCPHKRLSALFGLVLAAVLLPLSSAWATGGNEALDVVAPYGHFDMAAGTASGPLTTHYLLSNTTSSVSPVNIKCFNDQIQRVGPAAGTTTTLDAFEMEVWSPISLGLTLDGNYTGLGFCYFASTDSLLGDDIAVSFLVGVSEGNNLITTNDSVAITADTAQSNMSDDDANIPYWTEEGSWDTYVLLISPTATGSDLDMNVYTTGGTLMGTWSAPGSVGNGLAPRDLDMASLAGEIPATAGGYGHADLDASSAPIGFGYMGWVVGLNNTSFQAFMYPIPLDKDDTDELLPGNRP